MVLTYSSKKFCSLCTKPLRMHSMDENVLAHTYEAEVRVKISSPTSGSSNQQMPNVPRVWPCIRVCGLNILSESPEFLGNWWLCMVTMFSYTFCTAFFVWSTCCRPYHASYIMHPASRGVRRYVIRKLTTAWIHDGIYNSPFLRLIKGLARLTTRKTFLYCILSIVTAEVFRPTPQIQWSD